jgi:hypothetical protein
MRAEGAVVPNMKDAVASKKPKFLDVAETFYGDAFGPRTPKQLARSIADWTEMTPEEQSFATAHLAWLDLQGQAGTQKLLVQIRDLLEEIAESLAEDVETPEEPLPDLVPEVPETTEIVVPPAPPDTESSS